MFQKYFNAMIFLLLLNLFNGNAMMFHIVSGVLKCMSRVFYLKSVLFRFDTLHLPKKREGLFILDVFPSDCH